MTTVTLSMNDQSIRLSLDDLENALLAAKRKPGQKVSRITSSGQMTTLLSANPSRKTSTTEPRLRLKHEFSHTSVGPVVLTEY
ncbi:hypothetical protein PS870_03721 [Pseudomonas fluorescens]|jgi:hypothetical protein|uniref:Uncharacterized protein n=1 Tax=Pseudomonas fluorescens TaxID=294 RepID=A0A5E7M5X0_PSEFL|nr:hypothetical protein [Pseudomonas fluorescens]VVP18997.1 hypothetical protein PS870_03721 [Pseudomonas fluorescens]